MNLSNYFGLVLLQVKLNTFMILGGKCPHCTEKTVNIRKEGSNKFFLLST